MSSIYFEIGAAAPNGKGNMPGSDVATYNPPPLVDNADKNSVASSERSENFVNDLADDFFKAARASLSNFVDFPVKFPHSSQRAQSAPLRASNKKQNTAASELAKVMDDPPFPQGAMYDQLIEETGKMPFCNVENCIICQEIRFRFTRTLGAMPNTPFARLCVQDIRSDAKGASNSDSPTGFDESKPKLCKFHLEMKKRFDYTVHTVIGNRRSERYESLYVEMARMDAANASGHDVKEYVKCILDAIKVKQAHTLKDVKHALAGEADRLMRNWDAQIEMLDYQITVMKAHKKAQKQVELQNHLEKFERQQDKKRMHPSMSLLEMYRMEPLLCERRRFREALHLVNKGKQQQRAEEEEFQQQLARCAELENQKLISKKNQELSCFVDKMLRDRRQIKSRKAIDEQCLLGRIGAAIARFKKSQTDELRKVRNYFDNDVIRARHLIEALFKPATRSSRLYTPPTVSKFRVFYMDLADVPKQRMSEFIRFIFWKQQPHTLNMPVHESLAITEGPPKSEERPKSASGPLAQRSRPQSRGVHFSF